MAEASRGYKKCRLVEDTNEYTCELCSNIVCDPNLTLCCGWHYCAQCLRDRPQPQLCPNPKCSEKENFSAILNKHQKRKVLELRVRCLASEECKWEGILRDFESHQGRDCLFVEVVCPSACVHALLRGKLTEHLRDECPKRNDKCGFCGYEATREEVERHQEECPKFPVSCPNGCGVDDVERALVECHLETCPAQEVECDFRGMGCRDKLQRKDAAKHLEERTQHHLKLVSEMCLSVREESRQRMEEKERELAEKERLLREESRQRMEEKEKELAEKEQLLDDLQLKMEEMNTKIVELTTRMNTKEQEIKELKEIVECQQAESTQFIMDEPTDTPSSPPAVATQDKTHFIDKLMSPPVHVPSMETGSFPPAASPTKHSASTSLPNTLDPSPGAYLAIFTVNKEERNKEIYFRLRSGHQMLLNAYKVGGGKRQTHKGGKEDLSLHVCTVAEEKDKGLRWPLHTTIRVELYDLSDCSKFITKELTGTWNRPRGYRPLTRGEPVSLDPFLTVGEYTDYLKHNLLHFRIY